MQITIFRPLIDDAGFLESTWHHVSEADGVRLQLQEELDPAQDHYNNNNGHSLVMRLVEQRRIVKGTFHPGRKILPKNAITYEMVYDCIIPSEIEMDDVDLWNGVVYSLSNYGVSGVFKQGNVTNKEEE